MNLSGPIIGSACYVPAFSACRSRKCPSSLLVGHRSENSYFGKRMNFHVGRRQQDFHSTGKERGSQMIRAAIFGVGAPEALLVGVVALVVFGPKGLAQAVKSLGATLRTFSPTIRELASVTNELSSTLQEQIGLDDIRNEFRNPPPDYYRQEKNKEIEAETSTSSSPDLQELDIEAKEAQNVPSEDLEARIAESKRMAWGGQPPESSQADDRPKAEGGTSQETNTERPIPTSKASGLSIDELEAELKRRREAANSTK